MDMKYIREQLEGTDLTLCGKAKFFRQELGLEEETVFEKIVKLYVEDKYFQASKVDDSKNTKIYVCINKKEKETLSNFIS